MSMTWRKIRTLKVPMLIKEDFRAVNEIQVQREAYEKQALRDASRRFREITDTDAIFNRSLNVA